MTVFTIFVTAAVLSFESTLGATVQNRGRTIGASVVAQALDAVAAMPFGEVAALNGHSSDEVLGPTTYTVTESVQEVAPPVGAGAGSCAFTAAGTDGRAVVVNVSVTWAGIVGNPETGQIELSPSANAISQHFSTLSLQVVGYPALQPMAGVILKISSLPPQQVTTDANGCAAFVGLPPSIAYAVTAVASSGLIDQSQLSQGTSPAQARWTSSVLGSGTYTASQLILRPPNVGLDRPSLDHLHTGQSVSDGRRRGLWNGERPFSNLTAAQAVGGNAGRLARRYHRTGERFPVYRRMAGVRR